MRNHAHDVAGTPIPIPGIVVVVFFEGRFSGARSKQSAVIVGLLCESARVPTRIGVSGFVRVASTCSTESISVRRFWSFVSHVCPEGSLRNAALISAAMAWASGGSAVLKSRDSGDMGGGVCGGWIGVPFLIVEGVRAN
jgi:hypothetical protein